MSEYSDLAMTTSAVLYLIALLAHAAEWAAARTLPAAQVAPSRELARAGVGHGQQQPPAPEVAAPDVSGSLAARIRLDLFGRVGIALTMIAFATHLAAVILRGIAADRFPWGNMYEFVTSALLVVVISYLVLAVWKGMRWLGLFVTLLAAIGQGLAVTVLYVDVAPLVPALHSVWFIIHIVAAVIAAGAFNLGGLASLLYLLRVRATRRGQQSGYITRLPAASKIDTFAYRMHAFALPVWTFTILAGAVWAQYAWGRFWGWDPKETWSLITWVVYAGYLHARLTAGWKGAKAAWVAVVGLATFWFNFVGINLLVSGMHSYAGI